MKMYFIKTNAGNEVVFVENGIGKMVETAPTGCFENEVDLYAENAMEALKEYAERNDFNNFQDIGGQGFKFEKSDFEECVLIAEIR